MSNIEDTLTDEEREEIEQAELESKREKTKYGGLVENDK